MSTVWMAILKFALSVVITAVAKIPPESWAKIGVVVTAWLEALEAKLPAGHPMIAVMNSYKARRSKLAKFRPETDDE